jgi:hypothetical protein
MSLVVHPRGSRLNEFVYQVAWSLPILKASTSLSPHRHAERLTYAQIQRTPNVCACCR